MTEEKTAKFTISMPADVAAAMDMHVGHIPSETRSGWLTALAVRELEAAGAMTHGRAKHAELIAAAEEVGLDQALDAVKRAARAKKKSA